jgi:hypothetical protein
MTDAELGGDGAETAGSSQGVDRGLLFGCQPASTGAIAGGGGRVPPQRPPRMGRGCGAQIGERNAAESVWTDRRRGSDPRRFRRCISSNGGRGTRGRARGAARACGLGIWFLSSLIDLHRSSE